MISREILREIGKSTGLHLYQQEKDYLIKLFLFNFYRKHDNAVFKGGTALRYLYGTERFSEDIDLNLTTTPARFEEEVEGIMKDFQLIGIDCGFIKSESFDKAITCEIWFHGPLYEGNAQTRNKFRIDAGERGGLLREPRWEFIGSEYPETKRQFLVLVMDERELLAEKLDTLMNRKKGRDLYDVWYMIKMGIEPDLDILERKSGKTLEAIEFPGKEIYVRDMGRLTGRLIPYEQVRGDVERALSGLMD